MLKLFNITLVNMLHPSLNEWAVKWHYHQRAAEKKNWEQVIQYACMEHGKPMLERVKVTVTYFFKIDRNRDLDNYTPKFILDGLVKAGILKDDRSKNLVELSVKIETDKSNPRTEICIEEVQK